MTFVSQQNLYNCQDTPYMLYVQHVLSLPENLLRSQIENRPNWRDFVTHIQINPLHSLKLAVAWCGHIVSKILVNTDSSNELLPVGMKPSPEPVFCLIIGDTVIQSLIYMFIEPSSRFFTLRWIRGFPGIWFVGKVSSHLQTNRW